MAKPHNQNRLCVGEPSHENGSPTSGRKRRRTGERLHEDSCLATEFGTAAKDRSCWKYPPELWDRLSKIPFIHSAVEEFERRTRARPSYPSPPPELAQDIVAATAARDLAQFARHGGPDLRDLRGFPARLGSQQPVNAISSSSRSQATGATDPTTSGMITTKKSTTPYHRGFEQHLTDHAVHPTWKSQKPDLQHTRAALTVSRQSLSPSKFSDGAFETFQDRNAQSKDEDDVKAHVVSTILGTRQTDHPLAINTLFGNLEPLTDGTLVPANPDFYYGAYPEELDRSIRDELAGCIMPSTMLDKPIVPNFFMEVKGPNGSAAVATQQARYDGAIGARAIHSLQSHGKEKPKYDGNVHTFSSTYHDGTLKLYAHHATAPTNSDGQPEYHMTQVDGWHMVGNIDSFRRGATAFRNARDLAKRHRDTAIQEANARASEATEASAAQKTGSGPYEEYKDDILAPYTSDQMHESVDALQYTALQDADKELQRHIAETSVYEFGADGGTPPVSHYLTTEEEHQEASKEPVAQSDSGMGAGQSRSKRSRQSLSPLSRFSENQVSKSRTRPSVTRQPAESSISAAGLVRSGPSGSYWVGTYGRRGNVYFRNIRGLEVKTALGDWAKQTVDGVEFFCWEDSESRQVVWAEELPKEAKKRGGRH